MLEDRQMFVRATFFAEVRGETDGERQAAREGAIGCCLPNVIGIFRFSDEKGDMAKHVAHFKQSAEAWAALDIRIEDSKLPRPILRLRRWWKEKNLESIQAKEIALVIRQMAVSDVVEECNGKLRPLSDNFAHRERIEEMYAATHVHIVICRGRLMEHSLEYVA